MSQDTCAICDKPLGDVMYRSTAGLSLTSLCRIHPAVTEVRACAHCGHLQTRAIADVDQKYYPETMNKLYLVNSPSAFVIVWKIVKGWLDPGVRVSLVSLHRYHFYESQSLVGRNGQ